MQTIKYYYSFELLMNKLILIDQLDLLTLSVQITNVFQMYAFNSWKTPPMQLNCLKWAELSVNWVECLIGLEFESEHLCLWAELYLKCATDGRVLGL